MLSNLEKQNQIMKMMMINRIIQRNISFIQILIRKKIARDNTGEL